MPIRTHRGRAAVYRRLWGWPLRSPKHLALAVVLVAVAATSVGFLLPEPPPSPDRKSASRSSAERQPPASHVPPARPAPSPPSFSVPRTPPPPTAPNPEGLAAAEAWGRSWVHYPPGTHSQAWLARLRPRTTDEFLAVMATVDPANVPATKVTGPPTPMKSTATSMEVRLPTDAGDLHVSVISAPRGWLVAGYNKVG